MNKWTVSMVFWAIYAPLILVIVIKLPQYQNWFGIGSLVVSYMFLAISIFNSARSRK
jgi:hypothetical protein